MWIVLVFQVGKGERAEKMRTYNYRDGRVTDHRLKKNFPLAKVLDGYLEKLAVESTWDGDRSSWVWKKETKFDTSVRFSNTLHVHLFCAQSKCVGYFLSERDTRPTSTGSRGWGDPSAIAVLGCCVWDGPNSGVWLVSDVLQTVALEKINRSGYRS